MIVIKNRSCLALCGIWNRATDPAVFRSEHEANRARLLARIANRHMRLLGYREGRDWTESDYTSRRVAMSFVSPFTGQRFTMKRVNGHTVAVLDNGAV